MSAPGNPLKVVIPIVVVVLGGAYAFFGVYQPRQEKKAAQAEILEWTKRWEDARSCLVGTEPASDDMRLALAARQMLPDPWDAGSCTSKLGQLTRPAGVDTGLASVERAWTRQDVAVIALAKAFGDFTVNMQAGSLPVAAEITKQDKLPEALAEVAAAHEFLRESAGLPKAKSLATKTITAITPVPVKVGTAPLTNLGGSLQATGLGFGDSKNTYYQVLVTPGADLIAHPAGAGVMRSVSAADWAAAPVETGIALGTPDAQGVMPATAIIATVPPGGAILGVVGSAQVGAVVYSASEGLFIVHSKDGVATVEPARAALDVRVIQDPRGARLLVHWTDATGVPFAAMLPGAIPLAPLYAPGVPSDRTCMTATKAWSYDAPWLMALDGTGAATIVAIDDYGLIGCSATSVLLRDRETTGRFAVCPDSIPVVANVKPGAKPVDKLPAGVAAPTGLITDDMVELARPAAAPDGACRMVTLNDAPRWGAGVLMKDSPGVVVMRDRLLGVWREGKAPALFSLPDSMELQYVLSDGKTLDVYGTTNTMLVLARIPLP